ncbi:hypothetical protein MMC20_004102 [Loxospora ochrophaea]|nr:hypothetical protein [Loxospora ochrophaea]
MPTVQLVFLPGSLARLEAISKSPFLSQYVRRIVYHGNMLPHHESMIDWYPAKYHTNQEIRTLLIERSCSTADERSKRAAKRSFQKMNEKDRLRISKLEQGWERYQKLCSSQEGLSESDLDFMVLREVMTRLPRLESFHSNVKSIDSCYVNNCFGRNEIFFSDESGMHGGIRGQRPLLPLLQGIKAANKTPKDLYIDGLSWRFLMDETRFGQLKEVLRRAEKLSIFFSEAQEEEYDSSMFDWDESYWSMFPTRRCQDLVATAQELSTLALGFRQLDLDSDYGWIDIRELIGSFTWPKLRCLQVQSIQLKERTVLQVLHRHSNTLRDLCLKDVCITEGSWISIFETMRQTLSLKSLKLTGYLNNFSSQDESWNQSWDTFREAYAHPGLGFEKPEATIAEILEARVLAGAACPNDIPYPPFGI